MYIKIETSFFKNFPLATITAFKFQSSNIIQNQEAYNELKSLAIDFLKDEATQSKYQSEFVCKKIGLNSYNNLFQQGQDAFDGKDILQNVLNMLSIISGYTFSSFDISDFKCGLSLVEQKGELIYESKGAKLSHFANADLTKTHKNELKIVLLESIDQTDYEHYLNTITLTTKYLSAIFNVEVLRNIMSVVNESSDLYSQAEIDWSAEGWDQYGEISLIKKSCKSRVKAHI